MKKTAREITEKFAEKLKEDSNTRIDISSSDKDLRRLASSLNEQLKLLREAQIRCEQGDKDLKEAVINISHDLRTPLTAICGYLDLLEQEETSEQVRRCLQIITERTEAIRILTEELMKYSVSASAEQTLETEDVILNNILEESISGFYAALTEQQITPEIDICEEKLHRQLNRTALSRIFSNILSNAIKYSTGDLKITLSEKGVITFSNHTEQLDEVALGKLFDRYYTVENASKSTGLGLSIARLLTEQMGGTISANYRSGVLQIQIVL